MLIKDNNRTTFGVKISPHIWRDSNGQLICRDCIIARTGSYDYLESEIMPEKGNKNKIVKVYRTDDEVFNPISMASFENKPFVNDHPEGNVSLDNYKELAKGYMLNVRRGDGELSNCLMCDIVVTDPEIIEDILSGRKRELSLGYDTTIIENGGKYYMTEIRGNHLALVDDGRAGCATIRDSASRIKRGGQTKMLKKQRVKLFDEDIYEIEELPDEDVTEELDVEEISEENKGNVQQDEGVTLDEIKAMLLEIKEMLSMKSENKDSVVEMFNVKKDNKDEDVEEIKAEEENVDGDKEIVEEKLEQGDCGGKLLDADEIEEKEVIKTKDAKSVYAKYAKLADKNSGNVTSEAVNKSFQDRYNRAAKKN